MSETLIRRYYAAFNAGDWAGMLDCLTDDVAHDVNQGPRETGRDAFRAFLGRMEASYREQVEDLVVMATPDGRRAAAEFTIHGTYLAADAGLPPAQGQSYVLPVGAFFAIRDGRIARVTNYYNLENWLAQVRIPQGE
ncbi:ketosteroid isomerase-related protein [Roseococcus pinisoli]|uniref:Nuclear transport factor 2 family protein n=1 Tax=Roseococcus pinisoli TaxID=2835040 RepID=A0ABS5QBY4_9PROT|nr:ketosteroid isomerase-related protein [Roseococcus pinisoli]MBS7810938.1 nuclear transport factor 2 family protein [Roseococcus pinisoli]